MCSLIRNIINNEIPMIKENSTVYLEISSERLSKIVVMQYRARFMEVYS